MFNKTGHKLFSAAISNYENITFIKSKHTAIDKNYMCSLVKKGEGGAQVEPEQGARYVAIVAVKANLGVRGYRVKSQQLSRP